MNLGFTGLALAFLAAPTLATAAHPQAVDRPPPDATPSETTAPNHQRPAVPGVWGSPPQNRY